MSNVNPPVQPYAGAGYETAERVSNILNILSYLVVLVGVINAVLVLIVGFNVSEPWMVGGYKIEDDWESIVLSLFAAGAVLVWPAVGWALIQSVRLVVRYVGGRPMIAE